MNEKCGKRFGFQPFDPATGGRKPSRIEVCYLPADHTGYHDGGYGPFGPWVGPDHFATSSSAVPEES